MSEWNFGGAFANTESTLQQTEQSRQKFPLELQQLRAEVEDIPLKRADAAANIRYKNALTEASEHKLRAENEMKEIMKGVTLNEGETQSAQLLKLATAAMKGGDATTAREALLRASQARLAEAREAEAEEKGNRAAVAHQLKLSKRYTELMSGVQALPPAERPRAFAQANFLFESETGEESPIKEYDEQTVELLRQSAIKQADRIREAHYKKTEAQAGVRIGNTQAYRAEVLRLRRAEEEGRNTRAAAAKKAGGKDVGSPTGPERTDAENLLKAEGKTKGLDATTRGIAATDLASRAKALRKQNPGVDWGEALQRALSEQASEGYFTTKKAGSVLGIPLGRDKLTYGRPGASPGKPLPMPANRSAAKPQTYYQTPKGPLLYLGGGKWQVPEIESEAPDEMDDDEEDE